MRTQSMDRRSAIKTIAISSALPFLPGCNPAIAIRDAAQTDDQTAQRQLLLKGGNVFLDGSLAPSDILIDTPLIAEIGVDLAVPDDVAVLDVSGKTILPGGIDPHVHLTPPWVDDFYSGSAAAVAGGITTVGNMSFSNRGENLLDMLTRMRETVSQQTIVDVVIHPVIERPVEIDANMVSAIARQGARTIKFFMISSDFSSQQEQFSNLMRMCAREKIVAMIHCEDFAMVDAATQRLVAEGKSSLQNLAASRPVESEVAATRKAIQMCQQTGATVYLVHLSSGQALQMCREAQQAGLPVFVETRPLYLHLTDSVYQRSDGPLFVGVPPIRTAADQAALWQGINNGSIATIGSDHAPWTRAQKLDPNFTIRNPRAGVNNLQHMLPMLYSDGVVGKKISLQKFVDITSTGPAKILGLHPRKGTIQVGADADLVIWDPQAPWRIDNQSCLSKAGFSIFHGRHITGLPTVTIRRGSIVYAKSQILGKPGSGKVLTCDVG